MSVLIAFTNYEIWINLILLRLESPSGMCTKLHTVAASNIEIMCRNHSIIACSCHIYMGVILHAHPVGGESQIWHNANGEVATTIPHLYNKLHQSHILFVKSAPGMTITSWSQHHFVAIRKPERHVHKASHCGSK